jgi:DNA primase
VYVVDGEKDVHSLERLGVTATCCPGGAKKWDNHPHYGYTRYFRKATVGVIIDRDEAGLEHMKQVVQCLRRVATVRVGRPLEHKDVTEHLRAGYGLGDLEPVSWTTDDAAIARLQGVGGSALGRPGARSKLIETLESTFTNREEMERYLAKELPHLQYVQTLDDRRLELEQRGLWERQMSGGGS